MSLYGPIFHRAQLERAVIEAMRVWAPGYLTALEDQEPDLAIGDLPRTLSYAAVGRRELAPELEPPYVLVTAAGTAQEPERDGDGVFAGWFAVGFTVEIEVNSPRQDQANYVVGLYCAALRTAIVQQATLGGIGTGLRWTDEQYDELGVAEDDAGARAVAGAAFLIRVDDLVTAGAGPLVPPEDPYTPPADAPTVTSVVVDVAPVPISEELP
jgi:hypothetical protein